jgi:muconate/chloromuconate cycloisomerase
MKITGIEVVPLSIDYNVDWAIATGMIDGIGYIIVKIQTDEGTTGIGEIGRYFEGETQAGVLLSIQRFLAPRLIGLDPFNIARLHQEMDIILKGNRFAKAAVDIAAYDLMGKALGVPVHVLLGGCYRDKIEVCQSIGIKKTGQAVDDARRYVEQGFRSLKVKIGLDPKGDIERVKTIRQAVGPDVGIRVDANQGYSPAEAIPTLRSMEEYDLMLIEQPVPLWDLAGMRQVRDALDTPILACESAATPQDVMALARHQAVDMINIKIGRPGGLFGAQRMAAVAEAADLPVLIGTMTELGVGTAAAAHLAAACRQLDYPCDITGPTLLVDDVLATPLRFEDGYLHLPEGPGLGVELDEGKVKHYTVEL